MTTLTQIREKVRKVTGSPSQYQLTDAKIDEYVNTFYLYDFPEHLRLFNLKKTYTFFTEPYIEEYSFPSESYLSVEPPMYVGGYQVRFIQDKEVYYMRWPPINQLQQVGTGNGVSTAPALSPIQSVPFIRKSLYISALRNQLAVTYSDNGAGSFDSEQFNLTSITRGNPTIVGCPGHPFQVGQSIRISGVIGMLNINEVVAQVSSISTDSFELTLDSSGYAAYTGGGFANSIGVGSVNYQTGAIALDWGFAPAASSPINAQYIFYSAGRPYDVLFYDSRFYMRPVPDKAYKVTINAFVQPTSMFADSPVQAPELREWWQLLAYGASMKVFADRADFDSIQNFLAYLRNRNYWCSGAPSNK